MEFWAVEVKSGKPLNVQPGEGNVIHLSQASLGELKANKNEPVVLYVTVDEKKLVLGTLLPDKLPQQLFDLVFDRDFELSHNLKSGSISFFGYKAANPVEDDEEGYDSDDSEDEDIPLLIDNGKAEVKAKAEKPVVAEKAKESKDSAAGKQKVKIVEPAKDEDDDDDSEDDDSDEDGSSDGGIMNDDDRGSEDEESDEEDDTPKKPSPAKKRGGPDSAIKTPASQKKAKLATPQKTDGKKSSGHVATPYPSKQAGKTPANKQSPKSGGSHSCGPCNKSFNSEGALASHTKAKHSTGK